MVSRRPDWTDDHRKVVFMDWLTTPPKERDPDTKGKLAQRLGVTMRTLMSWQKDPTFRTAWEVQAKDIIGAPERAQRVLDTLYEVACDKTNRNHVAASKLYLEATDAIKPKPIELIVGKPSELTDDELDALLAQGAAAMRQERNADDNTVVQLHADE